MNIYEKLLAITNEIGTVAKNLEVGVGKSRYKAVGEADVLKAVKELEQKYGIYSFPSNRQIIDSSILKTRKEYDGQVTEGNQLFMRLLVEYTFVNIEKPEETVTIISYGDGVDTQDKAPGKAMTYADKYALLKAYKIVTGEDPDQNGSPDVVNPEKDVDEKLIDNIKKQALISKATANGVSDEQLLNGLVHWGYKSVEEIKVKDYTDIMNKLSKRGE